MGGRSTERQDGRQTSLSNSVEALYVGSTANPDRLGRRPSSRPHGLTPELQASHVALTLLDLTAERLRRACSPTKAPDGAQGSATVLKVGSA